jgi:hypothetical protein
MFMQFCTASFAGSRILAVREMTYRADDEILSFVLYLLPFPFFTCEMKILVGTFSVFEIAIPVMRRTAVRADNNIVFLEPGNYTVTWDGEAITIVKN